MKKILVLPLIFIPLASCQNLPPAEIAEAKVQGDRVTFAQDSPQLKSISVGAAEEGHSAHAQFNGRVIWNEDATVRVYSPVAGRVRQVFAKVGDTVTAGTVLAAIDSPDYGQAQADLRHAESDLALAGKTIARVKELQAHGAAPRKDVEAAEADYARASAEAQRARLRLSMYGGSAQSVDYVFPLRATVSGTVVDKAINAGQEVRSDQMLANASQLVSPLFVISDTDHLWLQIDAAESDLPRFKAGQTMFLHSHAFPDKRFSAVVDAVSEFVDPATRTVRVRGSVENLDHLLKAEMFVSLDLQNPELRTVWVPTKAVFLKGDRNYVFVEEGTGRFLRREVAVATEQDHNILCREGLASGDRVVTAGALLLEQLIESAANG